MDNLEQLKKLMTFPENHFYFVEIIRRGKDHNETGTFHIKSYCLHDMQKFENVYFEDFKKLADYFGARIYINLNPKSFEAVTLTLAKRAIDLVRTKQSDGIRRLFESCCGTTNAPKGSRVWILDVDDYGKDDVLKEVDKQYVIDIVPTVNAHHILVEPHDVRELKKKFPKMDINKNNPTILYANDNLKNHDCKKRK